MKPLGLSCRGIQDLHHLVKQISSDSVRAKAGEQGIQVVLCKMWPDLIAIEPKGKTVRFVRPLAVLQDPDEPQNSSII